MSVEIICILDRSASMRGSEDEVLGSFNYFIKEQKKLSGKANVTVVLFDDRYEVLLERKSLGKVKKLTKEQYFVRGSTALYDSVGKTINAVGKEKKNVIILIQTDGQENCSNIFTGEMIKGLIKEKEAIGWSFKFIGSDLSKQQVHQAAAQMGIASLNTLSHSKTTVGFEDMTRFYGGETTSYRVGK